MSNGIIWSGRKFKIDKKRFNEVVLSIYNAAIEGVGIFKGGPDYWRKRYLPQWKLPKEFEFDPQRFETRDPKKAAEFLWTSLIFERQNISRYLMQQMHYVWSDKNKRWFFDPEKVASEPISKIEKIIHEDLKYKLKGNYEESPSERFLYNAEMLVSSKIYLGDPRRLISGFSVKEARENLMKFKGIGTGISNLVIIYFLDRKIAFPSDPENILFKVDVHKGRIPINTDCIKLDNGGREIHTSALVDKFENFYQKACYQHDLKPEIADAALWIIGSEVCAKRSYQTCLKNCPLSLNGLCLSNVPLNQENGRYQILDENNRRRETRTDLINENKHHQLRLLPIYKGIQTNGLHRAT